MLVPLRGAAEDAAVRGARALELACWCCCSVPLQGAVLKRRVRFGVGMLVPLQGAVAGCCCQSVRFGASVLVPLCKAPLQSAASGCCCLEQCVPCGAGLHGPFAGCRWRVLLSKGCLHLRNLGAATGCCCESAVCAMKLGCMASLQGGGCEMSKAWAFGLDGDYVYVAKKGERLVATKKYLLLPEVYVGVIRDREAIIGFLPQI